MRHPLPYLRYNLRGDLKHVLFEDVDEVEPE